MCVYVVHFAPAEVKFCFKILGNSAPFHDRKHSKQWCLREIAREVSSKASMPGLLQKRGYGKGSSFKLYTDKLHVDISRAQNHSAV